MASSEVAICNRALTILGQALITSLGDPGGAARTMRQNYPASRDAVLRSYPWNSATKRAALAASPVAPAFEYARAYQLPADCLRVIETDGDLDGATWRREGNMLLTDEPAPLRIRYVARITDPALFDPLLDEAIASHLAMMTGFAIAGTDTAVQRAAGIHQQVLREARAIDAREQSQDENLVADDWVNARLSGSGWR
jgi:hypothetical protein